MELKRRIDVHAHYLPPAYEEMLKRRGMDVLDGGIPRPSWTVEKQIEAMEQLRIDHSVLSISSPHLHMGDGEEAVAVARESNTYGASLMKEYPDQISVLASLPLPEIEASLEEIAYCWDVLHLPGVALQTNSLGVYLGDPILEPIMKALDDRGAVVSIHPTEPSAVPAHVNEKLPYPFMEFFFDTTRTVTNMLMQGTIRRYPHIQFLIPHAGAFLPILSDRLEALAQIFPQETGMHIKEDLASLYYDLGGIVMPKQYGVLRMITEDSHMMYGSDGTFTPLPTCIKLARDMDAGLEEEMAEMIYRENPLALFPYLKKE